MYKDKYLKYKTKYLELKNNYMYNMEGGSPDLIIHISGPSGAGKTTLGNKLKTKYNDKIIVKDIDDLRSEFMKEHYGNKEWDVIDKDAYQQYIDNFINKQDKPLIFVGLNHMPWWHPDLYYDMHSTHKFYIDISNENVIKQKCIRYLNKLSTKLESDKAIMNDLINNNEEFIRKINDRIKQECDAKEPIKLNEKWNKDYKNQDYIILPSEKIYDKVCKILNKKLKEN